MYKVISLLILFFFEMAIPFQAQSQITFNRRLNFGSLAAILTGIVSTDSCYYATGVIADTVFPYSASNLFVKFDLEGNVIFNKTITSPGKSYEAWENTLIPLEYGGFALSGYAIDSLMRAMFIKYDSDGDMVFFKEYFNPNYPLEDYLRPFDMKQTPDGGFVMASWLGTLDEGNTDIFILKLDSLGNEEWHKIYGTPFRERPESIIVTENGNIIVGAQRNNTNMAVEDYTYTTWIFGLNSQGGHQWSYFSPYGVLRDAANDMILLGDGSLLIASGIGTEYDWPSVNVVYFEKYILKLDPNKNKEWEMEFPGQYPSSLTRTSNLILTGDGSEFLAAGTSTYVYPSEDSLTRKGWLFKGTISGDSLWTREYVFLNNQRSSHTIYDIKETKDNGFIIAGESFDRTYQDSIPQQAWLLKVDEYGCLAPGCQLVGTKEVPLQEMGLVIYPNPVADYLNFYLNTNPGQAGKGQFRITDMAGNQKALFGSDSPGTTFIVPVMDYPAGTYILQYLERGIAKTSKLFIVP